ncbi:RNA polymerase sigma factor sigB-like, partial [Trifolium medium]|nr:RNA polymerase sigma factor sigB-like [Trifolium medium]
DSIDARSGRQTERKARRVRAAGKAATNVVSFKFGSTGRKKRVRTQEVDYSDPLRYLRSTTRATRLLTASEEVKLKGLKEVIKKWNLEVYGEKDFKIKNLRKEIEQLDLKSEEVGLSEMEVLNRKNYFVELWRLLKSKDALRFQQSRANWLKQGDANTSYFHACVKRRGKCNAIKALRTDEGWVEGVHSIKTETV